MSAEARIAQQFAEHLEAVTEAGSTLGPAIDRAASQIVESLLQGGKVLCCGNGGSGAATQLFSSKMVNRHERERPGLPAIALNNAAATMTAVGDDLSFEQIFSKQVGALGHPGDLLLVVSCSGRSQNILHAVHAAHEKQMRVVAITGSDGGTLVEQLREDDIEVRIPSNSVARIQELQLLVIHCLCELTDAHLLGS